MPFIELDEEEQTVESTDITPTDTKPAKIVNPFKVEDESGGYGSELWKGVREGAWNTLGSGGALAALAGEALGSQGLKDWGIEKYKSAEEAAKQYAGSVPSYTDVDSISSGAKYLLHGLGTLVPTMATSFAGGVGGNILGRTVLKKGMTELLEGQIKKEVAEEASKDALEKILGKEIVEGIAERGVSQNLKDKVAQGVVDKYARSAGAFLPNWGMETGGIYGTQATVEGNEGKTNIPGAIGYGALAAALDTISEMNLAKNLGLVGKKTVSDIKEASRPIYERMLKEGFKQGAIESATEGAQTILERKGVTTALSDQFISENPKYNVFSKEGIDEMINAAIIGGFGGQVMGTASGIKKPVVERATTVKDQLLEGLPPEEPAGIDATAAAQSGATAGGTVPITATPTAATPQSNIVETETGESVDMDELLKEQQQSTKKILQNAKALEKTADLAQLVKNAKEKNNIVNKTAKSIVEGKEYDAASAILDLEKVVKPQELTNIVNDIETQAIFEGDPEGGNTAQIDAALGKVKRMVADAKIPIQNKYAEWNANNETTTFSDGKDIVIRKVAAADMHKALLNQSVGVYRAAKKNGEEPLAMAYPSQDGKHYVIEVSSNVKNQDTFTEAVTHEINTHINPNTFPSADEEYSRMLEGVKSVDEFIKKYPTLTQSNDLLNATRVAKLGDLFKANTARQATQAPAVTNEREIAADAIRSYTLPIYRASIHAAGLPGRYAFAAQKPQQYNVYNEFDKYIQDKYKDDTPAIEDMSHDVIDFFRGNILPNANRSLSDDEMNSVASALQQYITDRFNNTATPQPTATKPTTTQAPKAVGTELDRQERSLLNKLLVMPQRRLNEAQQQTLNNLYYREYNRPYPVAEATPAAPPVATVSQPNAELTERQKFNNEKLKKNKPATTGGRQVSVYGQTGTSNIFDQIRQHSVGSIYTNLNGERFNVLENDGNTVKLKDNQGQKFTVKKDGYTTVYEDEVVEDTLEELHGVQGKAPEQPIGAQGVRLQPTGVTVPVMPQAPITPAGDTQTAEAARSVETSEPLYNHISAYENEEDMKKYHRMLRGFADKLQEYIKDKTLPEVSMFHMLTNLFKKNKKDGYDYTTKKFINALLYSLYTDGNGNVEGTKPELLSKLMNGGNAEKKKSAIARILALSKYPEGAPIIADEVVKRLKDRAGDIVVKDVKPLRTRSNKTTPTAAVDTTSTTLDTPTHEAPPVTPPSEPATTEETPEVTTPEAPPESQQAMPLTPKLQKAIEEIKEIKHITVSTQEVEAKDSEAREMLLDTVSKFIGVKLGDLEAVKKTKFENNKYIFYLGKGITDTLRSSLASTFMRAGTDFTVDGLDINDKLASPEGDPVIVITPVNPHALPVKVNRVVDAMKNTIEESDNMMRDKIDAMIKILQDKANKLSEQISERETTGEEGLIQDITAARLQLAEIVKGIASLAEIVKSLKDIKVDEYKVGTSEKQSPTDIKKEKMVSQGKEVVNGSIALINELLTFYGFSNNAINPEAEIVEEKVTIPNADYFMTLVLNAGEKFNLDDKTVKNKLEQISTILNGAIGQKIDNTLATMADRIVVDIANDPDNGNAIVTFSLRIETSESALFELDEDGNVEGKSPITATEEDDAAIAQKNDLMLRVAQAGSDFINEVNQKYLLKDMSEPPMPAWLHTARSILYSVLYGELKTPGNKSPGIKTKLIAPDIVTAGKAVDDRRVCGIEFTFKDKITHPIARDLGTLLNSYMKSIYGFDEKYGIKVDDYVTNGGKTIRVNLKLTMDEYLNYVNEPGVRKFIEKMKDKQGMIDSAFELDRERELSPEERLKKIDDAEALWKAKNRNRLTNEIHYLPIDSLSSTAKSRLGNNYTHVAYLRFERFPSKYDISQVEAAAADELGNKARVEIIKNNQKVSEIGRKTEKNWLFVRVAFKDANALPEVSARSRAASKITPVYRATPEITASYTGASGFRSQLFSFAQGGDTNTRPANLDNIATVMKNKMKLLAGADVALIKRDEIPREQLDGAAWQILRMMGLQDRNKPTQGEREQALNRARNEVEGFFINNKVYIVVDNINSSDRLAYVMIHETLGHYGLSALGKARKSEILNLMKKDAHRIQSYLNSIQAQKKVSELNEQELDRYAEEALVNEAPNGTLSPTLFERIVSTIRDFARQFFNLKLSDNDINIILHDMRNAARAGENINVRGEAKFSLSQTIQVTPQDAAQMLVDLRKNIFTTLTSQQQDLLLKEAQRQIASVEVKRDKFYDLIAENGERSRYQNEYLYRAIRTPWFKEWFGNSQVRYPDSGEPQMMLHVSGENFESFDPGPWRRAGEMFFAEAPGFSNAFAENWLIGSLHQDKVRTIQVFIKADNIFNPEEPSLMNMLKDKLYIHLMNKPDNFGNMRSERQAQKEASDIVDGLQDVTDNRSSNHWWSMEFIAPFLKSIGFDGHYEFEGTAYNGVYRNLAIYDSNKISIKHVNNSGLWNKQDDHIMYSLKQANKLNAEVTDVNEPKEVVMFSMAAFDSQAIRAKRISEYKHKYGQPDKKLQDDHGLLAWRIKGMWHILDGDIANEYGRLINQTTNDIIPISADEIEQVNSIRIENGSMNNLKIVWSNFDAERGAAKELVYIGGESFLDDFVANKLLFVGSWLTARNNAKIESLRFANDSVQLDEYMVADNLRYIGKNLVAPLEVSMQNLLYVGRDALIINPDNMNNLLYIGGNARLEDVIVNSMIKLEYIGGKLDTRYSALDGLKYVEGDVEARYLKSNKLKYIGGNADLVSSDVRGLRYVNKKLRLENTHAHDLKIVNGEMTKIDPHFFDNLVSVNGALNPYAQVPANFIDTLELKMDAMKSSYLKQTKDIADVFDKDMSVMLQKILEDSTAHKAEKNKPQYMLGNVKPLISESRSPYAPMSDKQKRHMQTAIDTLESKGVSVDDSMKEKMRVAVTEGHRLFRANNPQHIIIPMALKSKNDVSPLVSLAELRGKDTLAPDELDVLTAEAKRQLSNVYVPRDEQGRMVTESGEPSMYDHEYLYKLVRTPWFRDWFGDSEITYPNGEPRPMYHITDREFNKFEGPSYRKVKDIFFAEDPDFSNGFGLNHHKPRIIVSFVKAKNIFDPENLRHLSMLKKVNNVAEDIFDCQKYGYSRRNPNYLLSISNHWSLMKQASQDIKELGFNGHYEYEQDYWDSYDKVYRNLAIYDSDDVSAKNVFNTGIFGTSPNSGMLFSLRQQPDTSTLDSTHKINSITLHDALRMVEQGDKSVALHIAEGYAKGLLTQDQISHYTKNHALSAMWEYRSKGATKEQYEEYKKSIGAVIDEIDKVIRGMNHNQMAMSLRQHYETAMAPFIDRLKVNNQKTEDIGVIEKYMSTPVHKAKRFSEWAKALAIQVLRLETRAELNYRHSKMLEPLTNLAQRDKAQTDRVSSALIHGDRDEKHRAMLATLREEYAQKGDEAIYDRIIEASKYYSDEKLRKDYQLDAVGISAYRSVRDMFEDIHADMVKKAEDAVIGKMKNKSWYPILQGLGEEGAPLIKKIASKQRLALRKLNRQLDSMSEDNMTKIATSSTEVNKMKAELHDMLKEYYDGTKTDAEIGEIMDDMVHSYRDIKKGTNELKKLRASFGSQTLYFPREFGDGNHMFIIREATGKMVNKIDANGNNVPEKETKVVYFARLDDNKVSTYKQAMRDAAEKLQLSNQDRHKMFARFDPGKPVQEYGNYVIEMDYKGTEGANSDTRFFQISDANLLQLFNETVDSLRNIEGVGNDKAEEIRKSLVNAAADIFKARGWSARIIKRNDELVLGYEEKNVLPIIRKYYTGYNGMVTKRDAMLSYTELMKGMSSADSAKEQGYLGPKAGNLREDIATYIKDMTVNADMIDMAVNRIKGVASAVYLGFNPKSALVQITQNFVTGLPFMAQYMRKWRKDGIEVKGLAGVNWVRAAKDALSYIKDNNSGALTQGEKEFLHTMYTKGISADQAIRDVRNVLEGNEAGRFDKTMDMAFKMFSGMETFNRQSMALAVYRMLNGKTDKDGKVISEQYLMKEARDMINDTHYMVQGQSNAPRFLTGQSTIQKFARLAYTFQSFQHQYWLSMLYNFKKDGKLSSEGMKTMAHSLAYLMLIGGATALPLFSFMMDKLTDDKGDDVLSRMRKWLRSGGGKYLENFGTYGAAGLFGINLSSSLSMNMPVLNESPFGVAQGIAQKASSAVKYAGQGDWYRMGESLAPEVIANPMKAIRMGMQTPLTAGVVTTPKGKIAYDEHGKPLTFDAYDMMLKMMGFSPMDYTEALRVRHASDAIQKHFTDERNSIYEQYRVDKNKSNPDAMKNMLKRIKDYNAEIKNNEMAKILVRTIKPSDAIKTASQKPDYTEKKRIKMERNVEEET